MKIQKGEKIKVVYNDFEFNTTKKYESIVGEFIKDYGEYIQIYDKFNIRRTIMKQSIINLKIV